MFEKFHLLRCSYTRNNSLNLNSKNPLFYYYYLFFIILHCRVFLFGALWKCVTFKDRDRDKEPRKLLVIIKDLWRQKRLPKNFPFSKVCAQKFGLICYLSSTMYYICVILLYLKNKDNQTSHIKYNKMNRKKHITIPRQLRWNHTQIKIRTSKETRKNMLRFRNIWYLKQWQMAHLFRKQIKNHTTYVSFVSQPDIKSHHLWLVKNSSYRD